MKLILMLFVDRCVFLDIIHHCALRTALYIFSMHGMEVVLLGLSLHPRDVLLLEGLEDLSFDTGCIARELAVAAIRIPS